MSRDLTVRRGNLSQMTGKNCLERQDVSEPDT
ncbi:hypothetical protein C4K38_1958 [Pseudomonas chlororaphis subsp. piscium]|nr:hypothetical protein C4K38_1958 [Pseudomonas chlororaphis subsp. piscium]